MSPEYAGNDRITHTERERAQYEELYKRSKQITEPLFEAYLRGELTFEELMRLQHEELESAMKEDNNES